jgi:hypothetical protein
VALSTFALLLFTTATPMYAGAPASDIHLFDVKNYGAVGDGATNDRAAIQSAIDAAEVDGGTVYFPAGVYYLDGDGSELLLIEKQIRLLGDGYRSILAVAGTVPNTTDVIRINPTDFAYLYGINGITITAAKFTDPLNPPARHAINIDIQEGNEVYYFAKFNMENCFIGIFGDYSIKLTNPYNIDGFFTSVFQNNVINGGMDLDRAGDTLNIIGNQITGPRTGVKLSMVPGASHVTISHNNITSHGGAIHLTSGSQVKILYNQIEQIWSYTGTEDAMISINGSQITEIIGNNMNGFGSINKPGTVKVANNIRVHGANKTRIHSNYLSAGTGANIVLDPEARNTEIGSSNIFFSTAGAFVTPTTGVVNDGVGTMGVEKAAALQNGWQNYGLDFQEASFIKGDDRIVHLSGLIADGTTTLGTLLFTLPESYRPQKKQKFVVSSSGGLIAGDIEVHPNGDVILAYGSSVYLSLSGISFSAEDVTPVP